MGRTKPITFRTVIVSPHNDRTQRINDLLIPNASFIRCLVIQGPLSDAELPHVRRLLESARQVLHLAVTWSLWAQLPRECGALALESLYLIWDGASKRSPSLKHLNRPSALRDLTIFAPADLHNLTAFRPWGELYLPDTTHCTTLAYITYAADRYTSPTVGSLCEDISSLQGAMFVLVNIPEHIMKEGNEDEMITDDMTVYSCFSTAYLPRASQVLGEWVAKMEGRASVLVHPPPHAVELDE